MVLSRKCRITGKKFEQEEAYDLAREYEQIYGIVIELFDKLVEPLGDEPMSLQEYTEILDAGFEEAKVGMIPPTMDCVLVGDIERTRLKDIKVLFFLGLNDGWVPKKEEKPVFSPIWTGKPYPSLAWNWHRRQEKTVISRSFICI